MTKIKIFKIGQKFDGVEDLYSFLIKNIKVINKLTGLQIQKPKHRLFCLTAKEMVTERNVILFSSKVGYPESLCELIILSAAFDADVIIFFLPKINKTNLESLNWLEKISNDDTKFFAAEVLM